jgi:hypothetical protein
MPVLNLPTIAASVPATQADHALPDAASLDMLVDVLPSTTGLIDDYNDARIGAQAAEHSFTSANGGSDLAAAIRTARAGVGRTLVNLLQSLPELYSEALTAAGAVDQLARRITAHVREHAHDLDTHERDLAKNLTSLYLEAVQAAQAGDPRAGRRSYDEAEELAEVWRIARGLDRWAGGAPWAPVLDTLLPIPALHARTSCQLLELHGQPYNGTLPQGYRPPRGIDLAALRRATA